MISRKLAITFSVILLVTLGPTLILSSVMAAKPHFSGRPTITKNSDLSITPNFKAAALGKKVTNASLSSLSTAQLGCVNPGGKSPPSKKVDFEQMQNQNVKIKPEDGKLKSYY